MSARPEIRVRVGRFRAKRDVFGTDSAWQRHVGFGTEAYPRRALGRSQACSDFRTGARNKA
jgi:hypothetical protein